MLLAIIIISIIINALLAIITLIIMKNAMLLAIITTIIKNALLLAITKLTFPVHVAAQGVLADQILAR